MAISEAEFTELYNEHWNWCVRRAHKMNWGRSIDAEAVAQEAMLALWKWLQTHDLPDDENLEVKLYWMVKDASRGINHQRRVGWVEHRTLNDAYDREQYYREPSYEEPETVEEPQDYGIPKGVLSPFEEAVWEKMVIECRDQRQASDYLQRPVSTVTDAKSVAVRKVRKWYLQTHPECSA